MNPPNQPTEREFRTQLAKYPDTLFESTQSFTAQCSGSKIGIPVTVERTAHSAVSQADADALALRLATAEAQAEVICRYWAYECADLVAPDPGEPAEVCYLAYSFLSQQDATDFASQQAQAAANAYT